ncbi:MAG: hypothetical protein K2X74_13805 [Acetobacteraceae bacterium]|nr:hypothetical protein [Acetobacteraceae bacterium]
MTPRIWAAVAVILGAALAGVAIAVRAAPIGFLWGMVASAVMGGAIAGAAMAMRWAVGGLPRMRAGFVGLGLLAVGVLAAWGIAEIVRQPVRNWAADAQMRSAEREVPLLAALREAEPALHAAFRDRVAAVLAEGGSKDDAARAVRPLITEAVMRRAPEVEDAILVDMLTVTIVQAREMQPRHPDRCAALLLGRSVGSFEPFVSPDLQRAERDVTERVLRAPRGAPAVAGREEAGVVFGAVLEDASQRTGFAPARILELAEGGGPDGEVCSAMVAVLEALLAQPRERAMPTYRFLLQQARGGR